MRQHTFYRLVGYLMIIIAIVLFGFNGNLSRLLFFSAPAWMVLAESLWYKRIPSAHVIIGIALTFSGIILLTGIWHLSFNGVDGLGLL